VLELVQRQHTKLTIAPPFARQLEHVCDANINGVGQEDVAAHGERRRTAGHFARIRLQDVLNLCGFRCPTSFKSSYQSMYSWTMSLYVLVQDRVAGRRRQTSYPEEEAMFYYIWGARGGVNVEPRQRARASIYLRHVLARTAK
jgi:hypothetical protein